LRDAVGDVDVSTDGSLQEQVTALGESVTLPSARKLRIEVGGSYMAVKLLDLSGNEKFRYVLGPGAISYYVDDVKQWDK